MKNTICQKITKSLSEIERTLKSKTLDVPKLSGLLHEIRVDAQKMENALKERKKRMTQVGLEDTYQRTKGDKPKGLNKIAGADEQTPESLEFEVIIKREGEVVYQNESEGGVVSLVERLDDIDEDGSLSGVTQRLAFGKQLQILFAQDQLNQSLEARKLNTLSALGEVLKSGKLKDPKFRAKLIKGQGI